MKCDVTVELTGGLAGLDVYEIKREALRLTVKYLAWKLEQQIFHLLEHEQWKQWRKNRFEGQETESWMYKAGVHMRYLGEQYTLFFFLNEKMWKQLEASGK